MRGTVSCFILYSNLKTITPIIQELQEDDRHNEINLITRNTINEILPKGCNVVTIEDSIFSTQGMKSILIASDSNEYILLYLQTTPLELSANTLQRMSQILYTTGAGLIYSDYYQINRNGEKERHPLIDYQLGSVRDDFDFGPLFLIRRTELMRVFEENPPQYDHAFFYYFILELANQSPDMIIHLNEYLYTCYEADSRTSGVKQFDYLDPRRREAQLEMERVCTEYLKKIDAYLYPGDIEAVNFEQCYGYPVEASVIIPVKDRVDTIGDAIRSALEQETDFPFNVIVVDNHSTDGTYDVIEHYTYDPRVIHLVPEYTDLGIGGCWNYATRNPRCGKFVVQLDSDDLYSGKDTLSRIVKAFYEQHCAAVVGSYQMTDFDLQPIPPGVIDHREWTPDNGRNNALRINGMGAPRAFYTPILCKWRFPNTSYGEDYALMLTLSREYRIGRIYEVLYLCRRWKGNSDAALSVEKVNANNLYKDRIRTIEIKSRQRHNFYQWADVLSSKRVEQFFEDQLRTWEEVNQRYQDLEAAQQRTLSNGIILQHNPARIVSTGAKLDKTTLAKRTCFLCNRPQEQNIYPCYEQYELLVNPFPILPRHYTLACRHHEEQAIEGHFSLLLSAARNMTDCIVFYNGAHAGASAPDHFHLQIGTRGILPLETSFDEWFNYFELYKIEDDVLNVSLHALDDYYCPAMAIVVEYKKWTTDHSCAEEVFQKVIDTMQCSIDEYEPRMNIIAWHDKKDNKTTVVIIPRSKHRPKCYSLTGKEHHMVSPGALDMGGLIITPRKEDYDGLDADTAAEILAEVGITDSEFNRLINDIYHSHE